MENRSNKYMNPYLAGFIIGLMLIAAYYFSGEGLGGSGAFKKVVIASVDAVNHDYASKAEYFAPHVKDGKNPLNSWLIFEILGVIAGAIMSAAYYGRLKIKIGKSPVISNKTRLVAALLGGIIWGVGSQLGRGCTSGLVMSGMAVNSLSGYIGLVAIFGSGYIFAWLLRKLWI